MVYLPQQIAMLNDAQHFTNVKDFTKRFMYKFPKYRIPDTSTIRLCLSFQQLM